MMTSGSAISTATDIEEKPARRCGHALEIYAAADRLQRHAEITARQSCRNDPYCTSSGRLRPSDRGDARVFGRRALPSIDGPDRWEEVDEGKDQRGHAERTGMGAAGG